MHSRLDIVPCPSEGLSLHSVCQICLYIFGGFARCSTGNQSKSGEKRTLKKKSYNVCADPEPIYHVMRAQMSRQDGGLSAMFILQAIELCNVSRVVLH